MGRFLSVMILVFAVASRPVFAEAEAIPDPVPSVSPSVSPSPSHSPFPFSSLTTKKKQSASMQILEEEFPIPKGKAEAPPSLGRKVPETPTYPCHRQYFYQGKPLGCDSFLGHDGENLRPYLSTVPAALHELNLYQETKHRQKIHAYLGTAGLAFLFMGIFAANHYANVAMVPGSLQETLLKGRFPQVIGIPLSGIPLLALPGLLFAAGNGVYAYITLQKNESHLGNAVQLFNQANPDNPIELQFSTEMRF